MLQRELKNFFSIVFKRLLDNLKASDDYDDGQSSDSDVEMQCTLTPQKNPIVNQGYFNRIECKNNKGPCNSVCISISKT